MVDLKLMQPTILTPANAGVFSLVKSCGCGSAHGAGSGGGCTCGSESGAGA